MTELSLYLSGFQVQKCQSITVSIYQLPDMVGFALQGWLQ